MKRALSFLLTLITICGLLVCGITAAPTTPPVEAAPTKLIAFTFDDGPYAATTWRLLDGLRARNVKATFFVNGKNGGAAGAAYHPDILRQMMQDGHQIANHTYAHRVPFDGLSASTMRSEVDSVNTLLYQAMGGSYQTLVRTPGGANSATIRSTVPSPIITWSVDTLDWKNRNSTAVYNHILSHSYDGAIVLMHDLYGSSVDGALATIDRLKSQGYEFVTVSELFRRRGVALQNGTVYYECEPTGINLPAYRAPTIDVAMSASAGNATVTLSAIDGGLTLYYTTDGSTPTLGSKRYTGPCQIPYDTTLTVAGFDKFGTRTPVAKTVIERQYEGVFDATYYADTYPSLKAIYGYNEDALLEHFLTTGLQEGKQASPVFSITYYRSAHSDLQAAFGNNLTAYLSHFMTYGMREGRRGSAQFDPVSYRLQYSDLRRTFGGNWKQYYLHYLRRGRIEHRAPVGCTTLCGATTVCDGVDYAAVYHYQSYTRRYPDIGKRYRFDDAAAIRHFVTEGMAQGLQGSDGFNVQSYRKEYGDLRRAFGNKLPSYYRHYMSYGKKEGRHGTGCGTMKNCITVYNGVDYAAVYDFNNYIARHSDIRRLYADNDQAALAHFVTYGMKEGRQANDRFNVRQYRNRYADLRAAFGDNLKTYYHHYINYGQKEGRKGY